MNFLEGLAQIMSPFSLELNLLKFEEMKFLPINVDSSGSRYSMFNFEDFSVQLIVNQKNNSEALLDDQSDNSKRSQGTEVTSKPNPGPKSGDKKSGYQNTIVGSYFRFDGLPVDRTPHRLMIDGFPIFFMNNNDKYNLDIGQRRGLALPVIVKNSRPIFDLCGHDIIEPVSRTSRLGKSTHAKIASVFPRIRSTYAMFLGSDFVYALSSNRLESLLPIRNGYCDFSRDGFKDISVFSCGRLEEGSKVPQSLMHSIIATIR